MKTKAQALPPISNRGNKKPARRIFICQSCYSVRLQKVFGKQSYLCPKCGGWLVDRASKMISKIKNFQ
jgi:predicted RNA-binding Zn-ribbon protein involved in translation (DUF1610 family)